jgi:hypothetical protein
MSLARTVHAIDRYPHDPCSWHVRDRSRESVKELLPLFRHVTHLPCLAYPAYFCTR